MNIPVTFTTGDDDAASLALAAARDAMGSFASESAVAELVAWVFESEGRNVDEVSVAIVDDATIHALNRKYLDHDEPTDVLAFDLTDVAGAPLAGEIVVNAELAVREAQARSIPPARELALYLIHGALHLCGHDDSTDIARASMESRQQRLLNTRFGPA